MGEVCPQCGETWSYKLDYEIDLLVCQNCGHQTLQTPDGCVL